MFLIGCSHNNNLSLSDAVANTAGAPADVFRRHPLKLLQILCTEFKARRRHEIISDRPHQPLNAFACVNLFSFGCCQNPLKLGCCRTFFGKAGDLGYGSEDGFFCCLTPPVKTESGKTGRKTRGVKKGINGGHELSFVFDGMRKTGRITLSENAGKHVPSRRFVVFQLRGRNSELKTGFLIGTVNHITLRRRHGGRYVNLGPLAHRQTSGRKAFGERFETAVHFGQFKVTGCNKKHVVRNVPAFVKGHQIFTVECADNVLVSDDWTGHRMTCVPFCKKRMAHARGRVVAAAPDFLDHHLEFTGQFACVEQTGTDDIEQQLGSLKREFARSADVINGMVEGRIGIDFTAGSFNKFCNVARIWKTFRALEKHVFKHMRHAEFMFLFVNASGFHPHLQRDQGSKIRLLKVTLATVAQIFVNCSLCCCRTG